MALSNPVPIPNPTEGIIRTGAIEDVVSQQNSVQEGLNVHYDRMGATTVRPGVTAYTSILSGGGSADKLGAWSSTGNALPQLLAQVGNDIRMWNGTVWTTLHTYGGAGRVRFAQFINYTYVVDGSVNDPLYSYDGTTYGTGNTGSLPPGDFVEAGLEGRLWVADQNTNFLWYSDPTPIGTPLTTSTNPNNFIYFSPNHGQRITGLKNYSTAMLVFMHDYIYRVYGAYASDAYPAYFVGTYSQESIVQAKDTLYFHHPSGFYRMTLNSQPQEISRRILDVVQAIPRANYENVFGWSDSDHVYWHVGHNIAVGGIVYNSLVCRYTISTQVWTLYDYFNSDEQNRSLLSAFVYDDGVNILKLGGVTDGNVAALDSGQSDLGSPIFYYEISRWLNITQLQSKYQKISQMAAMHQNASGASLDAQLDHDTPPKWTNIGTYNDEFATLFQSFILNPFNRIRFKKSGYSTGDAPIFGTLEILGFEDVGFKVQ